MNESRDIITREILQIADLKLGGFHRLESRPQVDPKTVNGSPTYAPQGLPLESLLPEHTVFGAWGVS